MARTQLVIGAWLFLLATTLAFHIGYAEASGMYDHKGRELQTAAVMLGMFPLFLQAARLYESAKRSQPK